MTVDEIRREIIRLINEAGRMGVRIDSIHVEHWLNVSSYLNRAFLTQGVSFELTEY